MDREEELAARSPFGTIERQSTGGHDRVDMRVKAQVARPGVQHHRDAKLGAEVVVRELAQRLGRSPEEKVEDDFPPESRKTMQHVRHREDGVKMTYGQDALLRPSTHAACASAWHFGQCRLRHELYEGRSKPHEAQTSRCPPSAGVRHATMARSTSAWSGVTT